MYIQHSVLVPIQCMYWYYDTLTSTDIRPDTGNDTDIQSEGGNDTEIQHDRARTLRLISQVDLSG